MPIRRTFFGHLPFHALDSMSIRVASASAHLFGSDIFLILRIPLDEWLPLRITFRHRKRITIRETTMYTTKEVTSTGRMLTTNHWSAKDVWDGLQVFGVIACGDRWIVIARRWF